mgnify:CR=1 FL=1
MLEYVLEQSRLSAAQTNSSNATAETTTPSSTVTNIGTLRNPIQLDKPQVPNVITLYEDDEEDEDDFDDAHLDDDEALALALQLSMAEST